MSEALEIPLSGDYRRVAVWLIALVRVKEVPLSVDELAAVEASAGTPNSGGGGVD